MKELKDTLWKAADKLRGSLPASQYKDVVLGLVFLEYISEAHWKFLADNSTAPNIGELADEAMQAVMVANPALAGMLPRLYHRVDQRRLGELVALLDNARFKREGTHRARDLMGEVYEYFLGNFARAEGKRGGEFFTPPSVVRVIVEVLEPSNGRVYDPCCGSGGMFVQTEQFVARRGSEAGDPGRGPLDLRAGEPRGNLADGEDESCGPRHRHHGSWFGATRSSSISTPACR